LIEVGQQLFWGGKKFEGEWFNAVEHNWGSFSGNRKSRGKLTIAESFFEEFVN
jgi:hypothetical protein